ncbi:E3 SUMO-protein ligase pli1 [Recurvomyces mirabilis]|uniref:E3 SUMO-protein ligase pli1 n=1 Tax=Recurvomyces mirabilis TaxID=574656 RepID=A0AAE0WR19_9PEZI|nr:E3 SUMO-protein ligase pli1 [Recurvomyces mirabilis]KAK5154831.1 E3 SUMO-protein ligase pli1 [Recurvomyces mirabilis]
MASGGHILQAQRTNIETQLKRAINQVLKEICRAYGKAVSGNKAELQRRCIEILNDIAARGDPVALDNFKYRLTNEGRGPSTQTLDSPANTYSSPAPVRSAYSMAPGRGNATLPNRQNPKQYFKDSPFYEIAETVLPLTDIPVARTEMPQNRNTVKCSITLTTEQSQRLANSDMRLLMYCGLAQSVYSNHPIDIAFPNQIEVKVNDDDVKANYKGLKNKPGSTKPADLTPKVRTKANYPNQITITYALTTKRYAFCIYLVRYVSAGILTDRIKTQSVIPRDSVIKEMRRANADPDIEATSTRMSLRDPVSTVRITLPVRSTVCAHTQCFDGAMFMQLVEQAPQWNCPVCNKVLQFKDLCVDKYFEDILKRTPPSIEKVDVEPDGEWKMIKDEDDDHTNGTSGKARAPYDDDFDDDIVELDGPTNKAVNGVKTESMPPIGAPAAYSFNTPPLSSREASVAQSTASVARAGNKRTAGAVIDLTLSDDEDQPPRPAKRHAPTTSSTTHKQGTTSSSHSAPAPAQQSYTTPSSLSDYGRFYQSQPLPPTVQGFRQADSFRPLSGEDYRSTTTTTAGNDSIRLVNDSYRHAGGQGNGFLHVPGSPHNNNNTTSYQQSYTNGNLSSTSHSPAPLDSPYSSRAQWAGSYQQNSRPASSSSLHPANGTQHFAIRPPPSPGGYQYSGVTSPPATGGQGMRLPPIQTEAPSTSHYGSALPPPPLPQDSFYGGWRSDGSYSGSPG